MDMPVASWGNMENMKNNRGRNRFMPGRRTALVFLIFAILLLAATIIAAIAFRDTPYLSFSMVLTAIAVLLCSASWVYFLQKSRQDDREDSERS